MSSKCGTVFQLRGLARDMLELYILALRTSDKRWNLLHAVDAYLMTCPIFHLQQPGQTSKIDYSLATRTSDIV